MKVVNSKKKVTEDLIKKIMDLVRNGCNNMIDGYDAFVEPILPKRK